MPIDKTYIDRIARRFDGLAGSFRLGSKTLTSDIDAYLWFCANLEEETKDWVPFVNKTNPNEINTNVRPQKLNMSSNAKAFFKRVGMYDKIIKNPDYKDITIKEIFSEFNTNIIKVLLDAGLIFVKTENSNALYSDIEDGVDELGVKILIEGKENALLDISSFKPTELEEFGSYLLDVKGKQIILNELGSREYVCQTVPDFLASEFLRHYDPDYIFHMARKMDYKTHYENPFKSAKDFLKKIGYPLNDPGVVIDLLKHPNVKFNNEQDLTNLLDMVDTKHEIIQQVLKVYHLTDSVSSAVDAYIGFVMPEESNVVVPEISF